MIRSKVGNIKSGWKSVFMIFTAASDDNIESIIESAFENVEQGSFSHLIMIVLKLSQHRHICSVLEDKS